MGLHADCNLNGVDDNEDVASGQSADCNDNQVPDECEHATLDFGFGIEALTLPGLAREFSSGDFNGDGFRDLVVAYRHSGRDSTVAVYLSRGDQTFEPPLEHPASSNISGLSVGDIDGDGDLDVATANSSELLVLRNGGDGRLDAPESYAVRQFTRFLRLKDVTGDGFPDLLTLNGSADLVEILANQGDGTFQMLESFLVTDQPVALAVADFDGDGAVDLAVLGSTAGEVSIHFNRDGRFANSVSFPAGDRPSDLRLADFDGDGSVDIITTNRTDASLLFHQGDGTFGAPRSLSIVTRGVAVSDLDGDGDPDIGLYDVAPNKLHWFVNNGDGDFGLGSVSPSIPRGFIDLLADDLDGDGDPDVIFSTEDPHQIQVLWNDAGIGLKLRKTVFNMGMRPHSGSLLDFSGDGFLDLITANGNNNMNLSVLIGAGDGFFAPPVTIEVIASEASMEHGGRRDLNFITAEDFDGDGDFDLAVVDAGGEVIVYPNQGDATFSTPTFYSVAGQPATATAADINGDGSVDVITANRVGNSVGVLMNLGREDGEFAPAVSWDVGGNPRSVGAVDLDRDGDLDLVTANRSSSDVSLLFNDGGGLFPRREDVPVPGGARYVTFGDFNQDGDVDLATANESGNDLSVLLALGDGTFGPPVSLALGVSPYSVEATDLNGDGALDLIAANEQAVTLSILVGAGDGSFARALSVPVSTSTRNGPRYAVAGDLDNDGDQDLVSLDRDSSELTFLTNEAPSSVGTPDFLETICTELDFEVVSVPSTSSERSERATKFLLPAREDAELLPPLFQNVRRFALHQEFLGSVFSERFPDLSPLQYNNLVGLRASRDYFVGVLRRSSDQDGPRFSFTVIVDASDPAELLGQNEVRDVYERLRQAFQLEPLCYLPDTTQAEEEARSWGDPGFPVCFRERVGFEAYTLGVGFGRVRILDPDALAAANAKGEISFQDVLVLEEAPRDIEGTFGGVITQEPQTVLSHLAIRTARRGTPNAFDATAIARLEPLAGKLVRLEVTQESFEVREATVEEATEFWESRPRLPIEPRVDEAFEDLPTLLEIVDLDVAAADGGVLSLSRFGGKATGLARLQGVLEAAPWGQYQERGFGIPVRYYLEFLRTNRLPSVLDGASDEGRQVTYEEYLLELLVDEEFQTNPTFRFEALDTLRDHMRDEGSVDPALLVRLSERIGEVLGSDPTTRVRFRSSSNIEDSLLFSGAGLYDSTSGCRADDDDDDDDGPSICDPTRENERSVARALKKVWASLWNFRAYEEREFFGIPHDNAAMAILVNRTFIDEAANGVAFTGNPSNPLDRRFVVTAQVGEESVVSPEPGVRAEKDLLVVGDGSVSEIVRVDASSLLPAGEVVLSDTQLVELGELMAYIDANYPLDLEGFPRDQVLLDLEFKLLADGELAVKQVRPFLLSDVPATPTFEVEIPDGTTLCGTFSLAGSRRGPLEEYELKSTVRLRSGVFKLSTNSDTFSAELVEEIVLGPGREVATAVAPGEFRLQRFPVGNGATTYRFRYAQEFLLTDGRVLLFALASPFDFTVGGGKASPGPRFLDEAFFSADPGTEAFQASLDGIPLVRYGSCTYAELPAWDVVAELEDGTSLRFEERFAPERSQFTTSAASILRADVRLAGTRQTTTDYFRLIYSAFKHNTGIRYWVVLDPAVEVPGVDGLVQAIELFDERFDFNAPDAEPARRASYLGADFEVLAEVAVIDFSRDADAGEPVFLRGDFDANGSLAIPDAIGLLGFLFQKGASPSCHKAADADDDGRIRITDAVRIAFQIFGRSVGAVAAPFPACGVDPTADSLDCQVPSCEGSP